MKYLIFLLLFFGCASLQDCPDNINLLPRFGEQKKCKEQIEADKIFLHECDSIFKTREAACEYHIKRGWDYFHANILDTSIMRFNQAWLLDSTNADIYWGFGDITGAQNKYEESVKFLERSIELNSHNALVWEDLGTTHGRLFFQTKNKEDLMYCIHFLKRSIEIDSVNARVLGKLTTALANLKNKDEARIYLKLTEKLDPKAVDPEVRKILVGE